VAEAAADDGEITDGEIADDEIADEAEVPPVTPAACESGAFTRAELSSASVPYSLLPTFFFSRP